MNLHQRAEFERQLAAYAEIYRLHRGAVGAPLLRSVEVFSARLHSARCDLITWVEKNVERTTPNETEGSKS